MACYGGVKIPENLADEMSDDQDLPYLEMLYKFVSGKQSYYDLASTRHVEPQANIERMSEEEVTTDRHDMREIERRAQAAKVRTVAGGAPLRRPQQGRKKQHWKVPSNPCSGSSTNPKMGRIFYIILTYSRMLSIGY